MAYIDSVCPFVIYNNFTAVTIYMGHQTFRIGE